MNSKVLELAEKINFMTRMPSFPSLSTLEHDLLLQHLRNLYDELESLRKSPTPKALDSFPARQEIQQVSEPVFIHTQSQKEEALESTSEPIVISKPDKTEIKGSLNESTTSESGLNEKLKATTSELHQLIGAKSLKQLIDFNKRFAIVNELFQGDNAAFSAAIQRIDEMPDFSTANDYVRNQLMSEFKWDAQSQSCKLFMKLLRQKFGEQ
ncbi:MAG: hypothetical protein IPN22_00585 [Bacteroidetes bacterium]|nr:hypothetical protein [Bacteroidota bacterium]